MQTLHADALLQGGRYKIVETLGQGGFGITYLAIQSGLDRKVAVKEFFMKELCERDETTSHVTLGTQGSRQTVSRFREKFLKEARNIARFNHPNIVRIIDVFEENGTAYYVMEYAENGSLADKVKDQNHLPEPVATRYILQVASALDYIHQQRMNHLDIKPANIMLNEKDESVLIDFGLSKQYDTVTGAQTSTTPVGISEGYAPMEQYKQGGVQEFSPETDIYALGATFYKLLTGKTPPSASDVNEDGLPLDELRAKGVSQAAIGVISHAMEGRKKDRTKSIAEFVGGLPSASSAPATPGSVPSSSASATPSSSASATAPEASVSGSSHAADDDDETRLKPGSPQYDNWLKSKEEQRKVEEAKRKAEEEKRKAEEQRKAEERRAAEKKAAEKAERERLTAEKAASAAAAEAQHNDTPSDGQTAEAPAKKRRSLLWLWILLGAVATTIIIVVILFVMALNSIKEEDDRWQEDYEAELAERMADPSFYDGQEQEVSSRYFLVKDVVGFQMMKVEAGSFVMGGTDEITRAIEQHADSAVLDEDEYDTVPLDELPAHAVSITHNYYIGQTEVTQQLWKAVMGNNPSSDKGDQKPVDNVSWDECQTFIKKLSQLTGQNFRLPTEAEWEFAARGGKNTRHTAYSGSDLIHEVAWYGYDNTGGLSEVGTKAANELGIYDMTGNVYEWCESFYTNYDDQYPTDEIYAQMRVFRGGGAFSYPLDCRVSFRNMAAPDYKGTSIGFRLALSE